MLTCPRHDQSVAPTDTTTVGRADSGETGHVIPPFATRKENRMKLEINGHSLKFEIVWSEAKTALKTILPLVVAVGTFLAAPAVQRLGTLLGWW